MSKKISIHSTFLGSSEKIYVVNKNKKNLKIQEKIKIINRKIQSLKKRKRTDKYYKQSIKSLTRLKNEREQLLSKLEYGNYIIKAKYYNSRNELVKQDYIKPIKDVNYINKKDYMIRFSIIAKTSISVSSYNVKDGDEIILTVSEKGESIISFLEAHGYSKNSYELKSMVLIKSKFYEV